MQLNRCQLAIKQKKEEMSGGGSAASASAAPPGLRGIVSFKSLHKNPLPLH